MNFFSTNVYLETLGEVWFPGRRRSVELFQTGGRAFRLLVIDGDRVITARPFLDFVQPLETPPANRIRRLGYLPRAVLSAARATGRAPEGLPPELQLSPYIDWRLMSGWASFEAMVSDRIGHLASDSRMRRRRLERDLGPLQVVFDDPRQEPFDRCLAWKSAQYLATGYRDLFERHENVQMFVELRRRGALVVTSLWAGELLLAAHLGAFADNRLYWWVPAYDPEFARYSPGRLMLEAMLRESFHRQHVEFDFLIGNEAYKWYYATHFRTIGPLGSPPLGLRIRQQAKRWVGRTVREHRRLAPVANGLKRALRVWRQ